MAYYYDELLKLCGFEEKEIDKERPRVEKAFQRLELGSEDMKRAESWVRKNHDVELLGVRKLLGAWLKELVDLVLAKDEGKKVVYYGFPTIVGPGIAIKAAAPDEVYCACPDVILCHTLGQIFNKLNPILEAGEQNGLPSGHGLCTLQTIRVGGMANGVIPVPDMVLTSSYYCDMGSKTDELLHERYGHPAIYVDGSMDSRWGEYPDYLPQRIELLGAQFNKAFDTVKEILGVEVTLDTWSEVLSNTRRLFHALGQLTQLMMADPLPVSGVAQGLAVQLTAGSTGSALAEGPQAVDILCEEVRERVSKGVGVVEKGAPRLLVFLHPLSDPSITHMMEDAGLAVAATFVTVPPRKRSKSFTFNTLGEERAEWAMRDGGYHSTFAQVKRFEEAVKSLKLDGVIYGYQFNCRPLALPSHLLPNFIREATGVPVLSLEMDYYDSRNYSAAAIRTRVEAFAEMLRASKALART